MFFLKNKVTVASVGMIDEQVDLFKKFIKHFGNKLHSKWIYGGNYDSTQTIESMGSDITADYLMIDIDDELGRRAWYFLSALREEGKTIAFTREPWVTDAKHVIKKPLFNYAKADKSVDPVKIVSLLNELEKTDK